MDRADALKWVAEFEKRVVEWDGVYRTGDHCVHCRRFHECQAGNTLARSYVAAVSDVSIDTVGAEVMAMEPDPMIALYHKARLVKANRGQCTGRGQRMRQNVVRLFGTETRLYLDSEDRRELDVQKTWTVLDGLGFTDEDFAAVVKMPISKVEKRVAELAGKGNGAAAKRDLAQKLELAGAITINEVWKLEERRN